MSKPALTTIGTEEHSTRLALAYQARAPWSRTATARWLNDRGPAVIAAARRVSGGPAVPDSRSPGYWLKENFPTLFARVHTRLEKLGDDLARERAATPEVVR